MALVLLVPLAIGIYDHRHLEWNEILRMHDCSGFVVAISFALITGTLLSLLCRKGRHQQGIKEGYTIVTLGWVSLALVSAIPLTFYFLLTNNEMTLFQAFTDGYFEVMSGFTTTGATILTDIEAVPRSLLFLRAVTHWLGGMGIITLAIAILPAMGVSGYQMFRGEVPGPSKDKLRPRLAHTATILWGVYILFSAVEALLLWTAGMNVFDAVCHTFATMATGGFSTKNASIAAFQSDWIEWIIILFMYFAGINFILHFKALRGDLHSLTRNKEFGFYSYIIAGAILITTIVLLLNGPAPLETAESQYRHQQMTELEFADHYENETLKVDGLYDSFRVASFQVLSIVSTTGFATADFDLWPNFLRLLLVLLMFFGGCAGSTGGGMKMIRVMVTLRVALNQLRKLTQPRLVRPVKIGDQPIDNNMVVNIVSFFILFIGLFVIVAAAMTLFVPDLTTAVTSSIATLGNIGPGLSGIGAIENYGWIPLPGKWILVIAMLLGRLEIFTVLIILRPAVWRR